MVASLSSALRKPAEGGRTQRPRPESAKKSVSQPAPVKPRQKWCGKYCIDAAKYSPETVGPKAMQLNSLKRSVRGKYQIENTVSIPFATIPEVLESHYENAGPASQVRHACAVPNPGHEVRSKNWKKCRHALSQIKIPGLMTEDLLNAFFAQDMVVPTTKAAWEQFREDIADSAALLFTPTYVDSLEGVANPLDLPVSLLVRDMQPREYDYIVNIDGSGEVTGEVRLPCSTNRGIRFATQGPGTAPGTVRPPCPQVGYAVCKSTVVLDGVSLPQAVGKHHAATAWTPPKMTFEGDNMLVLPQYKQQVYNMLTEMVRGVSELVPLGGSTCTVTGYITKRMEVVISDVYSDDAENDGSLWSWDATFL